MSDTYSHMDNQIRAMKESAKSLDGSPMLEMLRGADMIAQQRDELATSRNDVDALRARVAELERERDHAVRSADLLEDELHNEQAARRDFEHAWLEGRAIMAVCGYFSRMRGPDFWYIPAEGEDDEDALVLPMRTGACPSSYATQRAFPLYAGSAPVPAAQNVLDQATAYARDIVTWLHRDHYADSTAFEPFDDLLGLLSQIDNMICGWKEHPAAQAVDVDAICNAYESGVGHRGRPTAEVNPYREGTPEHEAYSIGAKGEAAQSGAKVADDVQVALDRLLDGAWWPSTIEPCVAYARLQDDTDGEFTLDHTLSIVFSRDGDAWLNVPRAPHSLRFRTYAGGGMSLRVRNALLVLAEAVRRDNEERPQIPSAMLAAEAKGGGK